MDYDTHPNGTCSYLGSMRQQRPPIVIKVTVEVYHTTASPCTDTSETDEYVPLVRTDFPRLTSRDSSTSPTGFLCTYSTLASPEPCACAFSSQRPVSHLLLLLQVHRPSGRDATVPPEAPNVQSCRSPRKRCPCCSRPLGTLLPQIYHHAAAPSLLARSL